MPHEAVSAKCLERTWAHSNDADLKFNRAVSKKPHLRCSELLPVFPHAVLSSIVYMEINTTLHIVWWRAGEKLRIVSLFPVPVAQHGQYKRSLCRERQAAGDKGDKDVCWRDKKSAVLFLSDVSFGIACNHKAELVIMGEKLSQFKAQTLLEMLVSVTTSHLSLEGDYSMVK